MQHPPDPDPDRQRRHRIQFDRQIQEKSARKLKARREQDRSLWYGLGLFGMVGWSVALRTLLGIALGIWIDSQWPSRYSWTLMLLLVGVILGCLNAWYWVQRERQDD